MQIIAHKEGMFQAGEELLGLSRKMRLSRERIEDAYRELTSLSELNECRRAIAQQEESVSFLIAGLVNLSAAIMEIAELYGRAEDRNITRMEDFSGLYATLQGGALYMSGGAVRQRIERILRQRKGE